MSKSNQELSCRPRAGSWGFHITGSASLAILGGLLTASAFAEAVGQTPSDCGPKREWKSEFNGLGWNGSCVPKAPGPKPEDPAEAQRRAQAAADQANQQYFNNNIRAAVRTQNDAVRKLALQLHTTCVQTADVLIKKFSLYYDLAGRHPDEAGSVGWSPYESTRDQSIYKWMDDAIDANRELCLQAFFKALPTLASVSYLGQSTDAALRLQDTALGEWLTESSIGAYALKTVARDFGTGAQTEKVLRYDIVPKRRYVWAKDQLSVPDFAAVDPVRKYLLRPAQLQALYREFDIAEPNPGKGHAYYTGHNEAVMRGLARQLGAFKLRDTGFYADLATDLDLISAVGNELPARYYAELQKPPVPDSAIDRANRTSAAALLKSSMARRIAYAGLVGGTDLSTPSGVSVLWRDYAQAGFTGAEGYRSGAAIDYAKYGTSVSEQELLDEVDDLRSDVMRLLVAGSAQKAKVSDNPSQPQQGDSESEVLTLEEWAGQAAAKGTSSAAHLKLIQDLTTLKTYLSLIPEGNRQALRTRLGPLLQTALPGSKPVPYDTTIKPAEALADAIATLAKASPLVMARLSGETVTTAALSGYQPVAGDSTGETEDQAGLQEALKGKVTAAQAKAIQDLEETAAALLWDDSVVSVSSVLGVIVGGPGSEVPPLAQQAATQLRPLQVQQLLERRYGYFPLSVYEDGLDDAWRMHLRLLEKNPANYGNPRIPRNVQMGAFRFWYQNNRPDEPPLPRDLRQMTEGQWDQLEQFADEMADMDDEWLSQQFQQWNAGARAPLRNRLLARALKIRQVLNSEPVPEDHSMTFRIGRFITRSVRSMFRSLARMIRPPDVELVAMATPQIHILPEFMSLTEPALLAQAAMLTTTSASLMTAAPATAASTLVATGVGTGAGLSALFIGILSFL